MKTYRRIVLVGGHSATAKLVGTGLQHIGNRAARTIENRERTSQRRLKESKKLALEHFLGRQRRNRFDLIRADEVVIQHATTNRQDSRRASKIGQRLREPDDIVIRDTKGQRAFEIWLQA